jgi:hypothetical protein
MLIEKDFILTYFKSSLAIDHLNGGRRMFSHSCKVV